MASKKCDDERASVKTLVGEAINEIKVAMRDIETGGYGRNEARSLRSLGKKAIAILEEAKEMLKPTGGHDGDHDAEWDSTRS